MFFREEILEHCLTLSNVQKEVNESVDRGEPRLFLSTGNDVHVLFGNVTQEL